jgi:hypothetical protein
MPQAHAWDKAQISLPAVNIDKNMPVLESFRLGGVAKKGSGLKNRIDTGIQFSEVFKKV